MASAPPATPTVTNTTEPANTAPAGSNTLQGAASDDSGAQPVSPAPGGATTVAEAFSNFPGPSEPVLPGGALPQPGTEREDPAGADSSNTSGNPPYDNETFTRVREQPITSPGGRPGRRPKNPLGSLASYTYQLSLYMITAPAYEAFTASGRRNINLYNEQLATSATTAEQQTEAKHNGVFLIAQSGGIGDSDRRAPGFAFDYYIDNLSFNHQIGSAATGASVTFTNIKFQIIEPYGFSFLTNLRKARDSFERTPPSQANPGNQPASSSSQDPLRQYFVLGIRFFGWDQTGRQVLGPEVFDGNPIDPAASGNGELFENFFDITITDMKFKLDGRATVYNITAAAASIATTLNMRKGMINTNTEVSGTTVRDYLSGPTGLITKLNQEQQNLVNNNTVTYPTVYKINWLGDSERIANSSMISPGQTNKAAQTASTASNTTQVTPATETTATPNSSSRNLSFANIPIVQAIDEIISGSSYIENSLAFNYTDSNESNPETSAPNIVGTPNQRFTWFHISPDISNIKWDPKISDWSYAITYTIQTYLVPGIDNPFVNNNTPYYGPHKRYDYWYTGQNTEVLKYEQEFTIGYTNIVNAGNPAAANPNNSAGASDTAGTDSNTAATQPQSASPAPVTTNTTSPSNKDGSSGTLSKEAVNSVRTTLYDPRAYSTAKVEILGDPDFLMQPSPTLNRAARRTASNNEDFNRFYNGGGFTIGATGGRVFFELDFKEAVDYSASDVNEQFADGKGVTGKGGTLSINDSIMFINYQDPAFREKVKGVVYMLYEITHNFKNGAFTQNLIANNPFNLGDTRAVVEPIRQQPNNTAATPGAGPSATGAPGSPSNSGTTVDQPPTTVPVAPSTGTPVVTPPTNNPDNAG
jgi:hypothetical protein